MTEGRTRTIQRRTATRPPVTPKREAPKPTPEATTRAVLEEVGVERAAQDRKWGEQNHDFTGGIVEWRDKAVRGFGRDAESWKRRNAARVENGTLGFDGILLEEVFEALGEADPAKRREELIQVAAVAVLAIEALDRKAAK